MENNITMQEEPTRAAQGERQENDRLRELLREDSELQRQFDRMVSRSLATARGKWERERDAEIQQAALIRDAEREAALEGREAALRSRELRAEALQQLSQKGLPMELADCLRFDDAQAAEISLSQVEKAFRTQVDKAVEKRMRGQAPKSGQQAAFTAQMRSALGLK
ncbi:MAG: DUF4355 domain-containing protein [Clostridia bacterium]|nr:DUF4355 domain-containing protein [Clostridia bacterium]MBP3650554.1 DUF4355 domain-containing protein [Clostridia bacterium]